MSIFRTRIHGKMIRVAKARERAPRRKACQALKALTGTEGGREGGRGNII